MTDLEAEDDDFDEWLHYGLLKGFITEPFCTTHDGDPYMSEEEIKSWDTGGDPCCHVLKLKERY